MSDELDGRSPVVGTLTAIHVYPVKSCRGIALDRADVTARGLVGDRQFQVIDAGAQPITQRQEPRLATVQPTLLDGGLRLEADGHPSIEIETPTSNDVTASSLLGVPVGAGDAGDSAAAWFSDLLGTPARLVAITDESDYMLPFPGAEMHLGWADGASILVANAASLDWLVERAAEPFGMDRFRPNLTIEADPWLEDTWRTVSIGAVGLGVGLAWPRCAIPQVDQLDGSRHREPAKVLRAHRWCDDAAEAPESLRPLLEGNALFGIACSVDAAGMVDEGAAAVGAAPVGTAVVGSVAIGDEVTPTLTGPRVIDAPSGR